jgi:hypothetical protein
MMGIVNRKLINITAKEWPDTFWLSEGPVKYAKFQHRPYQNFPLAWHIRDGFKERGDLITAAFFDRLEAYAGQPFFAENKKYYVSPTFGQAIGDASATQELYIFKNGTIVHRAAGAVPGIVTPNGSNIDFKGAGEMFPDSNIRVCTDLEASRWEINRSAERVGKINKDTVIFSWGSRFEFYRAGEVVTQSGKRLSDPREANEPLFIIEGDSPPKTSNFKKVTSRFKNS